MTSRLNILVTGADGHLGGAAVRHFVRSGHHVLATCRSAADTDRIAALAGAGAPGHCTAVACDLGDDSAVGKLIGQAGQLYGIPDCLLHAAGGFRWGATDKLSPEDYDFLMQANLKSSWHLLRHLLPAMKQRGTGRLVFVSSRSTLAPSEPNFGVYLAAKAGLNALVTGAASEVRASAVRINAVLPSIIDTPANRRDMPDADPNAWVPAEDILSLVDYLFSPASASVNGALIPLAGRL